MVRVKETPHPANRETYQRYHIAPYLSVLILSKSHTPLGSNLAQSLSTYTNILGNRAYRHNGVELNLPANVSRDPIRYWHVSVAVYWSRL